MDSFQLLAFLVDAVTTVHGERATVEFCTTPRATEYVINIVSDAGIVATASNADMRVALRDAVIAFDARTPRDSYPQPSDGFRLVAMAQRKRREAWTERDRSAEKAALALAAAEQLEAEALDGRPL